MENLSPLKHNANCLIFIRQGYAKGIALFGVIAILMNATRKQKKSFKSIRKMAYLEQKHDLSYFKLIYTV